MNSLIPFKFIMHKQGVRNCKSLGSKIMLIMLITDNSNNNARFLMWILSRCTIFIFQNNIKKHSTFLAEFNSDENKVNAFQNIIEGIDCFTQIEILYEVLCCSTNLSNEIRQRIIANYLFFLFPMSQGAQ